MSIKQGLGIAFVGMLGLSASVQAHQGPEATNGLVGDSQGHVIMDGRGDCVRDSAWTSRDIIVGCGKVETVAAPVQKPVPAPVPVAPPAPQYVTQSVSLTADALFDVNKANIKAAGKKELDNLAKKLAGMKVVHIAVTGYTDSRGAAAYNKRLSERRAESAKAYLETRGVPASLIDAKGMGEANPVASNKTAEGRAKNRRVEIAITGDVSVRK